MALGTCGVIQRSVVLVAASFRPHWLCLDWSAPATDSYTVMKHYLVYIAILTLLVATVVAAERKHYRGCFHRKCQEDRNSRRCCRIGAKVAKIGYDCTVDTVIATQRFKLAIRQKTRSMLPQQANSLFTKVKKCKHFDACFECCCKHSRRRRLNSRRLKSGEK